MNNPKKSYKLLIDINNQNLSSINNDTIIKISQLFNIEKSNVSKENKFGLDHYSFFENCLDLKKEIIKEIEEENDLSVLLISAWIEEISVYWLQKLFNKESCPIKKMVLLKMINDEHKHFLIFISTMKSFYLELDLAKEYNLVKNFDNTLSYSNSSTVKEELDFTEIVFEQFKGEVFTITELKYQYKETKCKIYKKIIKEILSDESSHVNSARYFKDLFTDNDIKLKFKRKIYSSMRLLNKTGMRPIRYSNFKNSFETRNINFNDYLTQIKNSKRSIEYVNDTYKKLYKLAKDIELISNMTYQDFINESGINR
jgi:rubrerythrin